MNKLTNKIDSLNDLYDAAINVSVDYFMADVAIPGFVGTSIKIADYIPADMGQNTAGVKPIYTEDQIVHQLTTSWGGGDTSQHLWSAAPATPTIPKASISFGINTANPINFTALGLPSSPEGDGLVAMTSLQVATAQLSFHIWDDLIPTSLVESGGAGANITLNYSNATSGDGSYTTALTYNTTPRAIAADQIWLSSNWSSNGDSGMVNGGYGFTTMMHEIGHSLGLSHPGVYNAAPGGAITYADNAEFAQDNRQNTIMSYFGGYDSSINGWTQDGTFLNYKYSQTPMVYDIAAIQSLYGADTTTRTGDTIYGYNTNLSAGDPEKAIFDFLTNTTPIFTIWDAGGSNDALDASGWNGNQTIDLMPGSYSSVRGLNNNVAIAFNTMIEKALGGTANDTLIGNNEDNILNGGGGNDTAVYNAWTTYAITGNSANATVIDLSGVNGTDTLISIEDLMFNGVTVTTEAAVNDAPVGVADDNANDPVVEAGTSVAGDNSAIGNVLDNDTDADSALGLGETKAVKTVNNQAGNVGSAVVGVYGSLTLLANGSYTYTLDNTNPATNALSAGQIVSDIFTYTVVDAHGASSTSTPLAISITGSSDAPVNTPPTLTTFAAAVATSNEDSETAISFADLQNQGNEADSDGSVTAFVIKAVSSGTLRIGASAATATAWDASGNASVDVSHNAYWTPAANANGTLSAFTVVARDNGGLESASPIPASVTVIPVNDAPVLTAPTAISYTDTVFDDTFTVATGSLVASDIEGNILTYSIAGGVDNGSGFVSKSSAYGVLTVTKATGAYRFEPNDLAIEALKAPVSTEFTVTVSDGLLSGSQTLAVDIAQEGVTESNGKDRLIGTSANDKFDGLAGNDFINGLAGADIMRGGLGNDTYVVDNKGDRVIETSALTTEIDWVRSSISYKLNANVENLKLIGKKGINGTGNGLDNILTGNAGANILDGGAGADTMKGGLGNDVYVVDNKGDKVIETSTRTSGIDQVNSSISYTLGDNVENLKLTGTAAINGTGNGLDNILTGNAAANILSGGAGADTLTGGIGNDILDGGEGNDTLIGNNGSDVFRFTTALTGNVDKITDFSVVNDTIQLENAIFTQLAKTGVLNANNFIKAAAAADVNDYVIYNDATGALLYDADGSGAGAAEQIALLGKGLALTHSDFVII
ncbi:MAG: M10 family metallopeptidase C-terminal domain-containing protein [Methylovulum sp.]|nr:M10 family metallopeptidase C-terminal domain-containing protein [Methylovulum sp.]